MYPKFIIKYEMQNQVPEKKIKKCSKILERDKISIRVSY